MCGRIDRRTWRLIDNLGNKSKVFVRKLMSEKLGKWGGGGENAVVFGLFWMIMIQ